MMHCRDIDEEYYVDPNTDGGCWKIIHSIGGEQKLVGFYSPKSQQLTWIATMDYQDKEFVEAWVRINLI
jgi:hypothetical protein